METEKDGVGSSEATAELSSPRGRVSVAGFGRPSADVDVGRLKTRVPFDVEEVNLVLGAVPFHLLRCPELERKFGKEAFQAWYDEAAKNKEKYSTTYPDIYGSPDPSQEEPLSCSQGPNPQEPVDFESLAFDAVCDSIPKVIRAYNQVHLDDDEIGSDVTGEAVEKSKAEYRRLNGLMKEFGMFPSRSGDVNLWLEPNDERHRPKRLEDWAETEAEWAEFAREVQREVDAVKTMCRNERHAPVARDPLTWIDQFVNAVEKETGLPFDKDFAKHMADSAAGKDSDISIHAHVRSLDDAFLSGSDVSDEEAATSMPESVAQPDPKDEPDGTNPEEPERTIKVDKFDEPPSADDSFNLEAELNRYVGLKVRFLLSCIHDDGKIKWRKNNSDLKADRAVPNKHVDEWYFGPKEFIILKDEGGKKTRTDVVVDREEDLGEKVAVIEGIPAKKKLRLASNTGVDKNSFLEFLLPSKCLKDQKPKASEPIDQAKSPVDQACQHRLSTNTGYNDSTVHDVPCEAFDTTEEERGRRLLRRKMYRWERFQFRTEPDVKEAGTELLTSVAAVDFVSQTEARDAPRTLEPPTHLDENRKTVADSLFQDDSKKFVEYVDPSERTLWESFRPMPTLTATNLSQGCVPELLSGQSPKIEEGLPERSEPPETSTKLPTLSRGEQVPPVTSPSVETDSTDVQPSPAAVDPAPTTRESPVPKKGKGDAKKDKKDKKKKKRRSSSSSDDLDMLEKKSEARLGLRK